MVEIADNGNGTLASKAASIGFAPAGSSLSKAPAGGSSSKAPPGGSASKAASVMGAPMIKMAPPPKFIELGSSSVTSKAASIGSSPKNRSPAAFGELASILMKAPPGSKPPAPPPGMPPAPPPGMPSGAPPGLSGPLGTLPPGPPNGLPPGPGPPLGPLGPLPGGLPGPLLLGPPGLPPGLPPGPPPAPPPATVTPLPGVPLGGSLGGLPPPGLLESLDAAMALAGALPAMPLLPSPSLSSTAPAGLPAPVEKEPPAPVEKVPPAPVEKVHWQTHKSPQGVPYYFCKKTGESRWVRPDSPGDVVEDEVPAKKASEVAPKAAPAEGGTAKDRLGEPETWETIGKTGWLRVETDKGFTYFYHKKKKKTSWTCPKEIAKEVAELDGVLGVAEAEPAQKEAETEPEQAKQEESAKEAAPEEEPVKLSRAERIVMRQKELEEERKVAKEQDKLKNFRQLLLEKGVKAFDKYEKWLPKLMHDARFTAISNQKERKLLFEALAKKIDKEKQKTQAATKRSGREAFKELLAKAEELELLQDCTAEKALKSMERRFEDDSRWDAVPERERERMVTEATEEINKRLEKQRNEDRSAFRSMVLEVLRGKEDDMLSYSQLRRRLQDDPRWDRVTSNERERIHNQIVREIEDARRKRKAQQRQVQLEAEEARKKRKLTEVEETLFRIFTERFKNPFSMEWEEVQDAIEDVEGISGFSDEEKEKTWNEYNQRITGERLMTWHKLLTNAGFDVIGPELEFEQVLERAFDASTAKDFQGMPEDILRSSWEDWRAHAFELASEDCQRWLRECKHLRGCEDVDPSQVDEFDRLLQMLKTQDIRFRRLSGRPEEQTRLLAARLKEMRKMREQGKSGIEAEDVG